MPPYWNLTASLAPLTSIVVFIVGLVIQSIWTRGTAKELARQFLDTEDGKKLPDEELREGAAHVLDYLAYDADRVQLIAALAVVAPSVSYFFDVPKSILPVLFVGSLLPIAVAIAITHRVDPISNRWFRTRESGPPTKHIGEWLSKTSLATLIILVAYFLLVLVLTPPEIAQLGQ